MRIFLNLKDKLSSGVPFLPPVEGEESLTEDEEEIEVVKVQRRRGTKRRKSDTSERVIIIIYK